MAFIATDFHLIVQFRLESVSWRFSFEMRFAAFLFKTDRQSKDGTRGSLWFAATLIKAALAQLLNHFSDCFQVLRRVLLTAACTLKNVRVKNTHFRHAITRAI